MIFIQQIQSPGFATLFQATLAGTHNMALCIEEGKYYFYDPDFMGGCEIELDTLDEVSAWLFFAAANYSFEILETNCPEYIPLSLQIFQLEQQA